MNQQRTSPIVQSHHQTPEKSARRHVNRMCVGTNTPLVESGTAGYLGQVEPFVPVARSVPGDCVSNGKDEIENDFATCCFECQPRKADKRSFPTCTIRNTPSEPIHCAVWAKHLFTQLFGQSDDDEELISPDLSDPELQKSDNDSTGISNDHPQINGNGDQPKPASLRAWCQLQLDQNGHSDSALLQLARSLVLRLYRDDLQTLVAMRDLWVDRKDRLEPSPLQSEALEEVLGDSFSIVNPDDNSSDQQPHELSYWLQQFVQSVIALTRQTFTNPNTLLVWDKDDVIPMRFVASASIIRAYLFHLSGADQLTAFALKSLAGNIVPAIATSNAIIAGFMIVQARRIADKQFDRIKTVYLSRHPAGRQGSRRLVVSCNPLKPNPTCLVCGLASAKPTLQLTCQLDTVTLRVLRDKILTGHLGMLAPDVQLAKGGIIVSSDEEDIDEETLDKTLAAFNVVDGTKLQCDDFGQDFAVTLEVSSLTLDLLKQLTTTENGSNEKPKVQATDGRSWFILGAIPDSPNDQPVASEEAPKNDDDFASIPLDANNQTTNNHDAGSKRRESTDALDAGAPAPAKKRARLNSSGSSSGSSVIELVEIESDEEESDQEAVIDDTVTSLKCHNTSQEGDVHLVESDDDVIVID